MAIYPPGWIKEPLFAAAAPTCHEPGCDQPLTNLQVSWQHDHAGVWSVHLAYLTCLGGHRLNVTP